MRCFTATPAGGSFTDAIFFASQDLIEFEIPEELFKLQTNYLGKTVTEIFTTEDFYWVLTHFTEFEIEKESVFEQDFDGVSVITNENVDQLHDLQVDVESELDEIVHLLLPNEVLEILHH